ncbi:hypothetical protein GGTG_06406 [Gaeumannomyces tritici R3-111a-1]|uniref:Uncharacterized protein n=1 Tax=Gaeumannomyces tritici (strain R3-111a-1) TaxID=644352 RepID=J3NYQ4_GAET3|nr:hypothetical protein GGTG_06406 [Gaeumannomyces tritici R3-111a-1]EJT76487.1 hypothetical protein GGTG_06406 [Gaeumannomyces tritici R3-111a-1]
MGLADAPSTLDPTCAEVWNYADYDAQDRRNKACFEVRRLFLHAGISLHHRDCCRYILIHTYSDWVSTAGQAMTLWLRILDDQSSAEKGTRLMSEAPDIVFDAKIWGRMLKA